MDDLIGVPVVGQPVVYAAGFLALLLVVFTGSWAGSIVTVAHEGGHMFMSVVTFRGFDGFGLADGGGGGTSVKDQSWGIGYLLTVVVGYLTPPLLGLGGAAILVHGNAWAILAASVVLLFVAFLYSENALAFVVTLVALTTVVLVLWLGGPLVQITLAAAVVWWLLIGGVRSAVIMGRSPTSDAGRLSRSTWIPTIVWKSFWITVALVCLYAGGRLLFTGTAWPAGVWPFDGPA
ncbi:M50 family metallopeptidase [Actinomycetospora sp. TBRC 11914]|uniref:M50 family metallopeptidase n=1 Tax=Actinomycetospora sp. TBRC 11914 TaxID=2729387 RepID=UPI00145E3026|nr:M50 family metallopeptidase [Actinomycetospora sp. TBRC 11914]NMO92766.1 M50 family peptidase [Actinomycetospora sp. TBRC 11914]